jgi:hypothetical protein
MLGFPPHGEIDKKQDIGARAIRALDELASEFSEWLAARGSIYEAPWGEIRIVRVGDQEYLQLNVNSQTPLPWEPQPDDAGESVRGIAAEPLSGMSLTTR